MEKWRIKGKRGAKSESVLPPSRRAAGPACLPADKKKDGRWSFGGFLRRISAGPSNDVSSNDEDITYIPGHLLSKRKTKKTSKMKSKLGRVSVRSPAEQSPRLEEKACATSNDTPELMKSLRANVDRSEDCLSVPLDDSLNSRSSEGSLDASGKPTRRIERVKARAKAKRDRLCGNSSSDDDSHRSSQSSMRFRSEDNIESAPSTRRTRAARTERYMKRIFRDDVTGCGDVKTTKPVPLPRSSNLIRCSSNSVDSSIRCSKEPKNLSSVGGSSPSVVAAHCVLSRVDKNLPSESHDDRFDARYLRDMNENETFERQKQTWPGSRRATPIDDIYSSLRSTREILRSSQRKLLPPEPPPRSSKSRIFGGLYGNAPSNDSRQSCRRYFSPGATTRPRYNSDNEVVMPDHIDPTRVQYVLRNADTPDLRGDQETCCRYDNCNSLDRRRVPSSGNSAGRRKEQYRGERENYDPRDYFEDVSPSNKIDRTTYSLPKGLELFSRQRLFNRGEACLASPEKPPDVRTTTRPSKAQENSQSPPTRATEDDADARRKRSSKNLEEALSELEAIYNSLRLSDDDLLERAEQRSMEEYRDRAAKSAADSSFRSCSETSSNEKEENPPVSDPRIKDDMAYRRMNPKERPASVNGQSSLSTISYLASSPNLSSRDNDYLDNGRPRSRRGTPDPTRDDLLYRSISHANSTLKVIEPQPPFGIPLGPVTTATESDYLHVRPSKLAQTRSLYIPKSEPDVVSDDLAFRNLRKDPPKDSLSNRNTNLFVHADSLIDRITNNRPNSGSTKKRSVRSMSADLYGIMRNDTERRSNDWYNDYIRSTQKLRFANDNADAPRPVDKEERESYGNINAKSTSSNSIAGEESSMTDCSRNNAGLDINGNRPRSGLQKKIQVYVPQITSIDEAMAKQRSAESRRMSNSLSPKPRDSVKAIVSEPDDDEAKPIESFTEQELSEYKQLCKDLEKLIQRTDEQEDDAEVARLTGHSAENNSQSEFDELEKLLTDDYELPVVESGSFEEIIETASTERDDDRSSSRSAALGPESLSSDCVRSSTTDGNRCKFLDDDGSSTSDHGNGSSNTASSLTDSVYDKFNKLLREVNDVPFVQPASTIKQYRADDLETSSQILKDEELSEGSSDSALIGISTNFNDKSESSMGGKTLDGARAVVPSVNSHENEVVSCPEESLDKPVARLAMAPKRETCLTDRGEIPRSREGERIEDETACNDRVYYACKDINTTMHMVRKLCHVTNSITAYHIVMCSFLLTLLITIIVAR